MAAFFNPENKFWSTLSSMVDAFLLNLMWLLTWLPIIWILIPVEQLIVPRMILAALQTLLAGAATTAYYYTYHKVVHNQQSGIWTEYWQSFKDNFKQATLVWLIFVAIFVMLYLDINICMQYIKNGDKIGTLIYFFYGILAVALIWFAYVFAYMARFENGIKATLKNAAVMAFSNIGYSLGVLAVMAAALYSCYLINILIVVVPAIAMALLNALLERVFRKFMTEEELEAELENDRMRGGKHS